MKENQRWTPSIRTESQEIIENISWNSTSSEESEEEKRNTKKFKHSFPNFQQDMKLTVMNPIKIHKIYPKERKEIGEVNNSLSSDISSFKSDENVIDFGKKSPVLATNRNLSSFLESGSPIISQNYLFREASPVLTDNRIVKKIKRKKREIISRANKIDGSSPDIFLSQKSKIIEENESPDKTVYASTNCSQDLNSIELISSQDSSSLVILNASVSESSVLSNDLSNQCYHQPSPRRKNCKKNGLLHQLQKSLNLQKSRCSLWHHDIFCKTVILSDLESVTGIINDKWRDFSCTILKCLKGDDTSAKSKDIFLISLGGNTDSNLSLNVGQIIKIYAPFKEKLIQFESREVKLFYNVFKVLIDSVDVQHYKKKSDKNSSSDLDS